MRLQNFMQPAWNVPDNVHALITLKHTAPLAQPNSIILPSSAISIKQVHGRDIARLPVNANPIADAVITDEPNVVCCVATADCLPILFCHKQALEVGAIHAGWRGLAAGVIQNSLSQFSYPIQDYLFWLAPCISEYSFEVEQDVIDNFLNCGWSTEILQQSFIARNTPAKFLGNLKLLATHTLISHGALAANILTSDLCTYLNQELFHSYRRDKTRERMRSLIWIDN
jgi:YfiH family protein